MRYPRPSDEHQEAVSRRLALLGAELAAVRDSVEAPDRPPRVVDPAADPGVGSVPAWHLPPPESPATLPRPGRHAQRAWPRVLGFLRRSATGGLTLGPAQLGVLLAAVVLSLVIAVWQSARARPEPVAGTATAASPVALATPAPTDPSPADPAPSSAAGRGVAEPSGGPSLVVDVTGRVRRPGIAVLPPGSRVVDAVDAAGGARRGADLSSLNLARLLVDGEQVVVGIPPPPGPAAAAAPSGTAGSVPGELVNLNQADQAGLETLPGVGPVTAQAILAWRQENGGFTAVEELLEVDGIGEATLEQLVTHVTV